MKVTLNGLTPLLMNRDSIMYDGTVEPRNAKSETYPQYEERIWRDKAHTDDAGIVIFPAVWIRKALIASQGLNANPIKPPSARRASATLKQNFVSGVLVLEDYPVLNLDTGKFVTYENLTPHKCMVSPQKGKVLCIRPKIDRWKVNLELEISDTAITEANVLECLTWIGRYNGVGDWRAQKGGMFGGFEIAK